MSDDPKETTREGQIVLVLSLLLWGGLMALFLGGGHLLAMSLVSGH